ncbi:MAG TPA: hypothetical protein PLV92_26315 [Pirellulaceae bacterium]|nr:hypothetical protein [Pirellulaceae bacterium]
MTADLCDRRAVPLHVQIDAAKRELGLRRKVYPRLVAKGQLRQSSADEEIAAMTAIVETLEFVMRSRQ